MKAIKPRCIIALSVALCAVLLFVIIHLLVTADDIRLPESETETAQILNDLGILKGDGNDLKLDEVPERVQAAIMVVRTRGEEEQALAAHAAGETENPFPDVTESWAKPYTAWLAEKGLVFGSGEGLFGRGDCATKSYVTFMLRALGYHDTVQEGQTADFDSETALKFAKKIGIYKSTFDSETFDRGLMASITYLTLAADSRETGECLLLTLTKSGAVDPNAALPLLEAFGQAEKLETLDMKGKTVTFLSDAGRHSVIGGYRPLLGQEQGDSVDRALYNRTAFIAHQSNVTLAEERIASENWMETLRLSVASDDGAYDVLVGSALNTVSAAAQGYLQDLNTVSGIDLSNPWWDDTVNAAMHIAGKQLALSGDLLGAERDAQMGLYYNPATVSRLGFEDPAILVQRGEWTLDVLLQMSTAHAKAYPNAPLTLLADRRITQYFYNGTGRQVVGRNEDNLLSFTLDGEFAVSLTERLHGIPSIWYSDSYENVDPAANLRSGQLLFVSDSTANAGQYLTSVNGLAVVPMPKLDAEQASVVTPVSFAEQQVLSIPAARKDDGLGALLEMMGKYSAISEKASLSAYGGGNNKTMLGLLSDTVLVDAVGLSAGLDHVLDVFSDKKGKHAEVLSQYRYQIESEISDVNGLLLAQQ